MASALTSNLREKYFRCSKGFIRRNISKEQASGYPYANGLSKCTTAISPSKARSARVQNLQFLFHPKTGSGYPNQCRFQEIPGSPFFTILYLKPENSKRLLVILPQHLVCPARVVSQLCTAYNIPHKTPFYSLYRN